MRIRKTLSLVMAILTVLCFAIPAGAKAEISAETNSTLGYDPTAIVAKDLTGITDLNTVGDTLGKTEYVISDAAGLNKLSTLVSAGKTLADVTFYVSADITVSENFVPIGTASSWTANYFSGTLDGLGHTVTVQYIGNTAYGCGLIGRAKNAIIRNLTVAGNISNSNASARLGALVGLCETSTVQNCKNEATVTGSNATARFVGGLIGTVGSVSNGTVPDGGVMSVKNCTNTGTVTSDGGAVGGIVGFVGSKTTLYVENCENKGTVKVGGTQTADNYLGCAGIVGRINNTKDKEETVTISHCRNLGTIESVNLGGGAGILGYMAGSTRSNVSILNCANYEKLNVKSQQKGVHKEGILGNTATATVDTKAYKNNADISADSDYHTKTLQQNRTDGTGVRFVTGLVCSEEELSQIKAVGYRMDITIDGKTVCLTGTTDTVFLRVVGGGETYQAGDDLFREDTTAANYLYAVDFTVPAGKTATFRLTPFVELTGGTVIYDKPVTASYSATNPSGN